ncbi:MAG: hypothetical protein R2734_05000 [Nocardioides sp.]
MANAGSSASATACAGASTGHQRSCSATWSSSAARRSGASGSVCSSTAWTRLPKAAPAGRSARGDTGACRSGTGPDGVLAGSTRSGSGSSASGVRSGSLPTAGSCSSMRISPE